MRSDQTQISQLVRALRGEHKRKNARKKKKQTTPKLTTLTTFSAIHAKENLLVNRFHDRFFSFSHHNAVDFFFIIDASPSMQDKIDTVRDGLIKFAAEIVKRGIDARYAVILLGDEPEMVVDWTDDAQFLQAQFSRIRATSSVANFQKWKGGQEAGFEAMRMALGKASQNKFYNENVKKTQPTATGFVTWRSTAQKFFILLTDEDCDRAFYPANRLAGQTTEDPPSLSQFTSSSVWVSEVQQTAQHMIDAKTVLYMFVNKRNGATYHQYGSPDCDKSAANFLLFNASATLTCLKTAGYDLSLEGRMLSRNATARAFDVLTIQSPQFIQNFFVAAVDQVSKCEKKRGVAAIDDVEDVLQGPVCERYSCDTQKGCVIEYTCAPGCTEQCSIGGKCYDVGQPNPADGCQYCNPRFSNTQWHTCGTSPVSDQCVLEECKSRKCVISRKCLPQCTCCCIGGTTKAMSGVCDGTRVDAGLEEAGKPPGCSVCSPFDSFFTYTASTDPKVCNPPKPTCTDGIQNQNEDLVDCGGPCPSCDKCKNGLMDNGEAGVDCGVAGAGPGCPSTQCNVPATPQPGAATDLCANGQRCSNGGKCVANVCNCAFTGFMGPLCASPEPKCSPTCSNGGICTTSLTCDCAGTGFEGPSCQQLVPTTTTTLAPASGVSGASGVAQVCETVAANACCGADEKSQCAFMCQNGVKACECDPSTRKLTKTECNDAAPFVPTTPEESGPDLGLIIGASVGGCVGLVLCAVVIWKLLPNAPSSMRYHSERHVGVQLKETDVL
jgi:hypothetical protein